VPVPPRAQRSSGGKAESRTESRTERTERTESRTESSTESKPIARVTRPQSSRRSLRDAVLLLAAKLEANGVDCSDVTSMLGNPNVD
jgi:hypothetical protein